MKKLTLLATAVCLSTFGLGNAVAGKNAPVALAAVSPGGCSFTQIAPFGTSLLASWTWADGTIQTKFGGDALFEGEASEDGITWMPFEVSIELEQYVPGTAAGDYEGQLVYRCSNAVSDPSGSCNGSVLGVRSAVINAAAEYLGFDPALSGPYTRASLVSVDVKAMNPGPDSGRQNYPLVSVCDVL